MTDDKSYIRFSHVTKKFGNFKALDDISLDIPKGCFNTLLGPSGCGKTTLMRQLAGFSEPDEGEIFVNGKKMNGLPPFKRSTPLVFQEYALFPHMTVYENISYGLRLQKKSKDEIAGKVAKMMEMFTLQGMEKRFPKELSGGQQQRVAFARALIMDEEVLLLDEPLSNLDAKLRVEVRSELRQIQQKFGITVIYVTHDQDEALSMSDQIAVMRSGRIQQLGGPEEIYCRPKNHFVADFIGTVNFVDGNVMDCTSDQVTVSWKNLIFPVHNDGTAFRRGETVEIVLRPEAILISKEPDEKAIRGMITFSSFLGRYNRYFIDVDGENLIVDDSNPSITGAIRGEVWLHLDQSKLHILSKEEG